MTTKKTKKIAAALAAVMAASTMASISSSAFNFSDANSWNILMKKASITRTPEYFVKNKLKNKSYKEVLDIWQKVQKGTDNAFPGGCDIDGDGVETAEEKNAVVEKVRKYTAGLTAGTVKLALNSYCSGLALCIDKPLGDFTNYIFGVKEASCDDVIKEMQNATNLLIDKITESENRIVNRITNINVASEYGKTIDHLSAKASTYRTSIKEAVSDGTEDEQAVAVALLLGDMAKWAENPLVDKLGDAREYMTSEYCTTDSENGNNLYGIAFQTAIDKGSLFMKEAVENTQRYIAQTTNKYFNSCITLLQMLTAMQKVSDLTPEQVSAMSETAQQDYAKIASHAKKAYFYEAEILNDLFGENGILTKSANYIDRKDTQGTTYIGRGKNNPVALKKDLVYKKESDFIEAYYERHFIPGYDYRWKADSDKKLIDASGLTYKEVEGICKHAFELGYTVENYLKANNFNIDNSAGDKRVIVTGHFDDFRGYEWRGYTSYEGLNGYDIQTGYAKNAGAAKINLIQKVTEDLWIPTVTEFDVENNNRFMFFVKA